MLNQAGIKSDTLLLFCSPLLGVVDGLCAGVGEMVSFSGEKEVGPEHIPGFIQQECK